jgi:hypothetical protein
MSKLLWIPKVLAIAFILFLLLFGADVFSGDAPFIEKLTGFLIHSIPALILMIILFAFWNKPRVAGSLLLVFAVAFIAYFKLYRSLSTFLMLGLPILLIAALFFVFHPAKKSRII